jgi:crotonobetainyl-CoA:carnitine CoA-transferase CaiB-like acyl-CoA transferase
VSQLKGIRVLELASVLAGPSVGQFFAELGAHVIKVENLKTGGDVTRTWKTAGEKTDDRSAYFCSVNWGKRSIALDLSIPEGQVIVQRLGVQSDIVIASYKPGDAEKLGVDYKTLSKDHPGLIYAQATGYGSHNPRVGYDAIIQAEAGFMFMNGEPGGPSLKMPVALIDMLAGHHLKEAILLAMLEKTMTGKGKLVEVSLLQAAVASLANQATNWLIANKLPSKQGSAHPNIAPYGDVFITADGMEMLLAVGSDQHFQRLCDVLRISNLSDNSAFSTNASRVENRGELNKILGATIAEFASKELLESLHKAKVPVGIIQNLQQVFEMREAKDLLVEADGIKGVKTFASYPDSKISSHFLPPPHLGQQTEFVLTNFLHMSPSEVKSLAIKKIIL